MHTDFLTHAKNRSWVRQINLLIYLNKDWQHEWQGDLELWNRDMSECVTSVAPAFNRCVIFNTLPKSYHGHPHRLCCPVDHSRKSLAIYYYQDSGTQLSLVPTDYQPLPSDTLVKRLLVAADRSLVALYSSAKSRSWLADDLLTRLLRRF